MTGLTTVLGPLLEALKEKIDKDILKIVNLIKTIYFSFFSFCYCMTKNTLLKRN